MEKVTDKKESGGRLEIFEDFKRHIFLARPQGFVNPSLASEDLDQVKQFAEEVNGSWSYVSDTSGIKFSNPINLMYLKEVKKLKNLKQIVIYVPSRLNQFLLALASFLIQPDLVITDEGEFVNFMNKVV